MKRYAVTRLMTDFNKTYAIGDKILVDQGTGPFTVTIKRKAFEWNGEAVFQGEGCMYPVNQVRGRATGKEAESV